MLFTVDLTQKEKNVYRVLKRLEIAGKHSLSLPYDSKCNNEHGHNWIITVECESGVLDKNGMVVDFSRIKEVVMKLDHQNINDFIDQPTAENIAKWVCDSIEYCVKVTVQESEGNIASYEL